LLRAGAKAGERPARWWQSQESVNPDCTPFPRAAQARGGNAIEGLVLQRGFDHIELPIIRTEAYAGGEGQTMGIIWAARLRGSELVLPDAVGKKAAVSRPLATRTKPLARRPLRVGYSDRALP
jgi:hypothetical protein